MLRLIPLLLFLLICSAACSDKVPEGALPASELQESSASSTPSRSPLTVEIGDEVEINVWRQDELQRKVRVDLAGNINLPLVGQLSVEGLTLEELRETVTQAYRAYIVDPRVEVSPSNLSSRQFIVLGEVREPGGVPDNP